MIPVPKISNPYYPLYTIIFRDSLPITENNIKLILRQFDNTDKLFNMVLSKFAMYEIVVGNVRLLYEMFSDIYNEYEQYYKELLHNYNKEYDYALGNRRRTTRHDTSNGNTSNTSSGVNDDYSLPNKKVDDPEGYLTSRSKDSGSFDEEKNNEYNSEVSVVYDNEFLDLKRKYLSQIRNVYSEFADKFSQCFMKVFN